MDNDSKYYDILIVQTEIINQLIINGEYDRLLNTSGRDGKYILKKIISILGDKVKIGIATECRKQNIPFNFDIQVDIIQPLMQTTDEILKDAIIFRSIILDLPISDEYV